MSGTPFTSAEVARAAANYEAQVQLFEDIREVSNRTVEEVARDIGITVAEAEACLSGGRDLTLTELRYLANACGVEIRYVLMHSAPTDGEGQADE